MARDWGPFDANFLNAFLEKRPFKARSIQRPPSTLMPVAGGAVGAVRLRVGQQRAPAGFIESCAPFLFETRHYFDCLATSCAF
jgi:hypothetical protein